MPYHCRRQLSLRHILILSLILLVAPATLLGQGKGAGVDDGPSGKKQQLEPGDSRAEQLARTLPAKSKDINLLKLLLSGKWFMVPIAAMSLLVVIVSIERFISLRKQKVIPDGLINGLGQLGKGSFDPRKAYRLCQQFPSAAANVIRAMLLKIGRPHAEVERAVAEVSQREGERLYANARWLNLAAAVSPLLGLLGTVWGLIRAFHDTTMLEAHQNKADYLAQGIYLALVTTLAGLVVAIPAAVVSHYFEGRVQSLFHQIDEMLFNVMPQVERYEGRVRFGDVDEKEIESPPVTAAEVQAAETTPAPG